MWQFKSLYSHVANFHYHFTSLYNRVCLINLGQYLSFLYGDETWMQTHFPKQRGGEDPGQRGEEDLGQRREEDPGPGGEEDPGQRGEEDPGQRGE